MNKTVYFVADYYNRKVIARIIEKYALAPLEAARRFLTSETHALLEDADNGLARFPESAVFDMWEAEQVTGDPRNSRHLRSE